MTEERWLTIPQVADWMKERGLPYNLKSVRNMATARKIPFKVGPDGRRLIIKLSDLVAAMDQGAPTPPPPHKKYQRYRR